jgi:hypothetical protein
LLALILGLAPQALCFRLLRRLKSNESLVVFDSIFLQEVNELVAKGDLLVMLLLSSNVLPHCFNIRLTYGERAVTTLPRKVP